MQIRKIESGITALVLAGIIFGLCLFVYGYLLYSVNRGSQVLVGVSQGKQNLEQEREKSLMFDIALRDYKKEIATMIDYFVLESNTPKFIEKLESLAVSSGVEMHLSSLASSVDKKNPSLAVALEVKGKYPNVARFIKSLELLPTRLVVDSLMLAKESSQENITSQSDAQALPVPTGKKINSKISDTWNAKIGLSVLSYKSGPQI